MQNNTPRKKKLGWIERTILDILKNEEVFDGKQSGLAGDLRAQKQDVNAAFKRLEKAGFITMEKIPGELCKKVTLRKENVND